MLIRGLVRLGTRSCCSSSRYLPGTGLCHPVLYVSDSRPKTNLNLMISSGDKTNVLPFCLVQGIIIFSAVSSAGHCLTQSNKTRFTEERLSWCPLLHLGANTDTSNTKEKTNSTFQHCTGTDTNLNMAQGNIKTFILAFYV